jgi:CheY-like chemotaxis protein
MSCYNFGWEKGFGFQPVVLTVDDDPLVLSAIESDLKSAFADRYRVLNAASGAAGLQLVGNLAARATPIALIIADLRMPQMTGTGFLSAALARTLPPSESCSPPMPIPMSPSRPSMTSTSTSI